MNFQESVNDPNRPLNVNPLDWMKQTEENLKKIDKEFSKVATVIEKARDDENALNLINNGVDIILQGTELILDGLNFAKRADLTPFERKHINEIEDIVKNAIIPYTVDLTKELDELDEQNE